MTVRGLASLRCVPVDADDLEVDVTPVDFAAKAMVAIAQSQMDARTDTIQRATWHIANPQSLKAQLLFEVLTNLLPDIEQVSNEEFQRRVALHTDADEGIACLSLCRCLSSCGPQFRAGPLDLFLATGITFDMTRTQSVLSRAGIHCPPPEAVLLSHYLSQILRHDQASGTHQ